MKKILISDLDRTLLKDNNSISERNLNALRKIRDNGIVAVIATGRNIFSAQKVINSNFPIDYLIFSSGAGIIDWKTGEIIFKSQLNHKEIKDILNLFLEHDLDFMIHDEIPNNHYFQYQKTNKINPDFQRRLGIYKNFATPLEIPLIKKTASQFIAILGKDSKQKFEQIKVKINNLSVIRATSPLDHSTIWLEVLPSNISKSHSTAWLCDKMEILQENSVGIGNDFNDLDLLNWTNKSFVVDNSPDELKKKFTVTLSNEENGFAEVMEKLLVDGS